MKIPKEELIAILSQFNPWWRGTRISDIPEWHRTAFQELMLWIETPPVPRAVMLSGPRQVGKTTLLLQAIQKLLDSGVPPANILYATFDHPICKLGGLSAVLEAWRELEPKANGPEYLFLDEAQFIMEIGTWIKHQVDFFKNKRIIFTGS
ncbi:MAG: ATP-binding protein, partial [Chlamydiae bacterium]|nr:ATP-binding protein [Chlamydiota bacterium]